MTTIETTISKESTAHTVVEGKSETSSGRFISSTFASMVPSAASTEMQPTTSFIQISSNEINSNTPSRETSLPYEYSHCSSLTITGYCLDPSGTFTNDNSVVFCTTLRSTNCPDDREFFITLSGCMGETTFAGVPSEFFINFSYIKTFNSATTLPSSSDTVRYAA